MAPESQPASGQNRGGRRRGRGGGSQQQRQTNAQQPAEGSANASVKSSKSRNRGGGRGAGGGRDGQHSTQRTTTTTTTITASDEERSRPQPAAEYGHDKAKRTVASVTEDADDGEICFICASEVEHISVSPCNHRTCHICALRLRALYKNKACAHCRTESSYVIFTDDPIKRFEAFTKAEYARQDDNLGIKYERDDIFEDTVLLLRYNCPDQDCDVACLGWPDLHRHVRSKHGKVMCDLCTRNKKVFTHEHDLFTNTELRRHEKHGDDAPGAINQSGFKGHPECGFCRQRFYGDDELYVHCRDRHERCHICDRRSGNRQQQYYIDYNALEEHFQKDHFLCLDTECLEKKFVVFESQMDLKAHQLECHPNGLTKDARRDARIVDISSFDYRTPYQPQRQRRGAGRGRDPNAESLPASSAQPLRRDEIAYQRQMAIQSAQSVSTRSFGGQLTRNDTQTVRAPDRNASSSSPAPARPSPPTQELENLSIASEPAAPATPQDRARHLRHAAVVERATTLLHNDPIKLAEFRSRVSNYRASSISATELIDSFFSLFDTSSSELGKLIKELADIYEDKSKQSDLLKAWNDWRAINEDYPALPGPGGILPGMSPGTVSAAGSGSGGGKRVLRLKSSTAQSSRSAAGRSGSIFSSSSSPSRSSSPYNTPFPPLSASTAAASSSSSSTAGPWITATSSRTPWVASAPRIGAPPPISSAPSASSRSPAAGKVNNANANANSADAFPSLPAAPKPNVLMPGLTRGTVRWDQRPPPSAWGGGSSSDMPEPVDSDFPVGGKKGKGKKGKQTLFHFG